jgi:very-short-patch-repair endonuclease
MILPGTGRGTAAEGGGGGGLPTLRKPVVDTARKLRREMSYPEVLLWQRLRGGGAGAKVRRQHPIGPYIADFYCSEKRLVIEVDGEAHERGDRPMRDEKRDRYLHANGYEVLRIMAADVLKDADGAAAIIAALLKSPLHRSPAASGPPPRAGEDQDA